jgi:hypothetical protein
MISFSAPMPVEIVLQTLLVKKMAPRAAKKRTLSVKNQQIKFQTRDGVFGRIRIFPVSSRAHYAMQSVTLPLSQQPIAFRAVRAVLRLMSWMVGGLPSCAIVVCLLLDCFSSTRSLSVASRRRMEEMTTLPNLKAEHGLW